MKFVTAVLLALFMLSSLTFVPQVQAVITFSKPSESSLWLTSDVHTGFSDNQFSSFSTDAQHTIIAPFQGKVSSEFFKVYGLGDRWSARAGLDGLGNPRDFIIRKRWVLPWYDEFIRGDNNLATTTFSGFNSSKSNIYAGIDDIRTLNFFIPYNISGFIADYKMTGINLGNQKNATQIASLDFQFADDEVNWGAGDAYDWHTGNTTASWNATMNAIVAKSTSQLGYGAVTVKLQSDSTTTWTMTYSIWRDSSNFFTWMEDRRAMDNATHGSLPTTSTNVFAALGFNNTSTNTGLHILHFTVYVTFAKTLNELQTNLNQLTTLNVAESYADSSTYWYEQYTAYNAINTGNDYLNRLYYWTKHIENVAHYGQRYFSAGTQYHSGYVNYAQDSVDAVFGSMASGLWENVERYLNNILLYSIDTSSNTYDGFESGTPYLVTDMVCWTITMYAPSGQSGTARATLDYLDSVVNYISWSGNTTFASANWSTLTDMIEAVQGAMTEDGVLPLTRATEDTDSSLHCNVVYYHILKEFSSISYALSNSSYAATLNTRATTLKTQLNKNVGSGGLWSPTAEYFVNSSSVSPSDENPHLWTWQNSLAITYDAANSTARKQSIIDGIESKTLDVWGFSESQFSQRYWFMKEYEISKAYARQENSSTIATIIWSLVNNPYIGYTRASSSTNPNFPEYWTNTGTAGSLYGQYAFASATTGIFTETLLGIHPAINGILLQPIKPANITTITGMNVRVRNAFWNISISGNGNYVSSVKINGAELYFNTIPTPFYSGNHTIEVTLGNTQMMPPAAYLDPSIMGLGVLASATGAILAWYWRRKTKTRTVTVP